MIKEISIVLPCYNEEENVENVAIRAAGIAGQIAQESEVIIVDDGSVDRTGEIAEGLRDKNPNIRVIRHSKNRGYGAALRSGFESATKDLVFYTDGDGQFDVSEITKILPLIEEYDIVTGYRIERSDKFMRRLNGFLWTRMVNLLFGLKLRDIDCAFKLYRKEVLDRISLDSEGALIDTEIYARARRLGFTIGEVGVHHYPRTAGQQSGADLRVILKAFYELFRLWKELRFG
jgi:glycosyltransferase involved in cell wall biosynthesis